jgi:hypothetical protein
MDNKFLRDFMRQQATLIQSAVPEAQGGAPTASKKGGPKKHKSKHGTADGKHPFGGDDMGTRLATIITEKPAKKEVLAYFRDRVAELVAEDEF